MAEIEFEPIGIRRVFEDQVHSGQLRTIFRPCLPKYKELYGLGNIVELRVILTPGIPVLNIKPVYTEDVFRVRIVLLRELMFKQLTAADFEHSYLQASSSEALAYHLGLIYDLPASRYTPETKVIQIQLEYIEG